jgi:hypothetical protein
MLSTPAMREATPSREQVSRTKRLSFTERSWPKRLSRTQVWPLAHVRWWLKGLIPISVNWPTSVLKCSTVLQEKLAAKATADVIFVVEFEVVFEVLLEIEIAAPAHQQRRYKPPAALTATLPQLTAAPLRPLAAPKRPALGKRGTALACEHVSRTRNWFEEDRSCPTMAAIVQG